VSGAAGATGSVACQLGKLLGAKVVAIAGSEDKCQWLENELGVDKALNYKSPTFVEEFKKSVGYLDVYFDNGKFWSLSSYLLTLMVHRFSWWRNSGLMSRSLEQACASCIVWYVFPLENWHGD
jgi:hypothetical protein